MAPGPSKDAKPKPPSEPTAIQRQGPDWGPASVQHFPMFVLPMANFLSLAYFEPFEEVEPQLVEVQPNHIVSFISHQWLGSAHPDPDGIQLRRMQHVFRQLIDGKAPELLEDWEPFSKGISRGVKGKAADIENSTMEERKTDRHSELTFEDFFRDGFVWLDFSSIPQGHDARAAELRSLAISSIPFYLERADIFFVCAPTAPHADLGSTTCNFGTWRERGWCRLEEWGRFLSQNAAAPGPLIVTDKGKLATYGPLDFMVELNNKPSFGPLEGKFSCCQKEHVIQTDQGVLSIPCDKQAIRHVLRTLWDHRMKTLRTNNNVAMLNCHQMYIEPTLFGSQRLGAFLDLAAKREAETLDAFLSSTMRPHACQRVVHTTAWHLAATMGHVPMLRKLMADPAAAPGTRADGDAGALLLTHAALAGQHEVIELLLSCGVIPRSEVNYAVGSQRITALDRAAKNGFPTAVKALIHHNADVNARRADESTPLMGAAANGHLECCKLLVAAGADPSLVDAKGNTAMDLAAQPLTLFGVNDDKPHIISLLLEHARENRQTYSQCPKTFVHADGAARQPLSNLGTCVSCLMH